MSFGRLRQLVTEVPVCPMCDGPCKHDFPRSEFSFPDRLPMAPPERRTGDPKPEKVKKANLRGRRPVNHAPKGPAEDRMVRPSEDR